MSASQLIVRECSWSEVWPQGFQLFRDHEKELGLSDASDPISINHALCAEIYRVGVLKIVGAFRGPLLVGYVFWYVSPSLISQHNIIGDQGPWYVIPELRSSRLGYRLFDSSKKMLKQYGVTHMMAHRAMQSPQSVAKLIEKFGGKRHEEVWEIKL